MANPVLVEVWRGSVVESRHRGSVAVMDADGGTVLSLGDPSRPVFPRSAVKALQALPLIESGAADRYGLAAPEIALACASHSGEERHAATAAAMLARPGLDVSALECGSHWPLGEGAARALAGSGGTPSALHNNCSGKHAGFLCLACHEGLDPAGYVGPAHGVQREVRSALEAMTGCPHGPENRGVDGCAIPVYAVPLTGLALAFARFGTGRGLAPRRAKAARRIREAVAAHPEMVAGTGRFDTRLMAALGERVFVKTGAEGVYCAALPEQGLGIALKCDDGAGRAAEVATAGLIARFLTLAGEEPVLADATRPAVRNWNGTVVGQMQAARALQVP